MKKITTFLLFLSIPAFSQFEKIIPEGPTVRFGSAVDVKNNEIAASSSTSPLSSQQAKIYVYSMADGAIAQTDVFSTADGTTSDQFGRSLSLGNDFLAVGSPYHDSGFTDSGAVYVYRKIDGHYQFVQKLQAFDANAGDLFGSCVKISGNNLYISAIHEEAQDMDEETNTGAVYHFAFDGAQWNFIQKIMVPADTANAFLFGKNIVAEEGKVIISSDSTPFDYGYSNYHIYTELGQTVGLESALELAGTLESRVENFDYKDGKLYLTEQTIGQAGATKVEIFSYQNEAWNLDDVFFVPFIPGVWSDFIYSNIEVMGDRLFLGAGGYVLAESRKFALLYFVKVDGVWTYQNVFYSEQPQESSDDFFGSTMASDGNNLVVGAPNELPGLPSALGGVYYLDVTTLAAKNFTHKTVGVYPNPTQDKIYFANTAMTDAKVYSVTGNLVLFAHGELSELSLAKLSSGMYLIKADTKDGQSQTFKIIKN
jgi:hypothetical protein